jgi:hypothetical protein
MRAEVAFTHTRLANARVQAVYIQAETQVGAEEAAVTCQWPAAHGRHLFVRKDSCELHGHCVPVDLDRYDSGALELVSAVRHWIAAREAKRWSSVHVFYWHDDVGC